MFKKNSYGEALYEKLNSLALFGSNVTKSTGYQVFFKKLFNASKFI